MRGPYEIALLTSLIGCSANGLQHCSDGTDAGASWKTQSCTAAIDLGTCLAAVRVRAIERHAACLQHSGTCKSEGLISEMEGKSRETCLEQLVAASGCRQLVVRIASRECVYGSGLKCRWALPNGQFTLACCAVGTLKNPPWSPDGGAECPSSNVCP